jgi:tRNA1(Val) A37 N6-methylase TrmN6
MELFTKYKPQIVLNCCSGWGGSLLASSILNIHKYIGIEMNTNLEEPYSKMISFLKNKTTTEIEMYFQDAVQFDYSSITYDCLFSSPPYYFLEKYENNSIYQNKKQMDEEFYIPLFTKTYQGLSSGGYYMINICSEVYDKILIPLLGDAHEKIPYIKYKRNNKYKEYTYCWKK